MAIDAATVRKVAHLARIKTPEDRLEPLAQAQGLGEDVVTDGDKIDAVLSNAPKSADGFFVVPKVVE